MSTVHIPPGRVSAVVLGIMQDGGLPHVGCRCPRCLAAHTDPRKAEWAACLGIVDRREKQDAVWLIDATPDIKHQLQLVGDYLGPHPHQAHRLRQPRGIFLTHGHMGHLEGLSQFGTAGMVVDNLQVFSDPGLERYLRETDFWGNGAHMEWIGVPGNQPVPLAENLIVTPLPVPHRDERGFQTYAYRISGPEKSLLYVPDIDGWSLWPRAQQVFATVDHALVDATFYSGSELCGRLPVAHPWVEETLSLFAGQRYELILTHFNHTNPVLDPGSTERSVVVRAGASIAKTGTCYRL